MRKEDRLPLDSTDRRLGAGTAVPSWPRKVVATLATYAMAAGSLALIGWAANIPRLTAWKNDGISMFPNTAVCALTCGMALLLTTVAGTPWRVVARLCAILGALVGGLTLLEHVGGIDLGIDTLLFVRPWGQFAAAAPMRMGPPASLSFLMIGVALLLSQAGSRARRASAALGVMVVAISMLSLTGHLYGAEQMYTVPRLTGIAMQTATALFAIGLGVVASVPDREPMRTILDPGAAGLLARRALPVIVVLALVLGWGRVFIQNQGWVDTAFGTASRTLVEIVLLTGLLWRALALVRAHEQALGASEAEVRRQASQLAAFLDNAALCLHRVDPDGVILWANDVELQTLGYTREEYVGHHISEFHADQTLLADILARLRRGEKLRDHPARMKCKDGSLKSVLIDSSVLWDEDRFLHTQCFTRDVTERERAEETRALLASIIAASDDAIVSETLDGVITSWNAGAERMFGYTAAEVIGKGIEIIMPPDRRDEERELLARLRRGERVEHFESLRRAKDGRILDISLTLSALRDESGRIIGASKIARDIGHRKRAEAEREESNRRKDEFIAILAHELRNPLAPVRNAARYLKLKGLKDADACRSVEMIERQVAQMSRLIDDLLDVSRISRGTLELRRERVLCAEIVDAALDACRDEIQAKGHSLRTTVPGEPVELEADRERLVQVLCNLIGNAAKYTPAGGRIDLRVAAVTGTTLEITVADSGIGIPPAKLTEIFDLFARVDHSLERQEGLGIGLTLVRQLVELHGGAIEARSQGIGHGSEFVLTLPIVATVPATAATTPEPGLPCPSLRIVVADDNRDAVESLALLLGIAGHEVHAAYDGQAAMRAVEQVLPDVALLDIGMPVANGYEIARYVRAQPWGKEIFLVALTGWGQDSDKQRAQEAGFDAHLVKPVPPEILHQVLATVGTSVPAASAPSLRSRTA
jgi:PAS domain S-box-containing protein